MIRGSVVLFMRLHLGSSPARGRKPTKIGLQYIMHQTYYESMPVPHQDASGKGIIEPQLVYEGPSVSGSGHLGSTASVFGGIALAAPCQTNDLFLQALIAATK